MEKENEAVCGLGGGRACGTRVSSAGDIPPLEFPVVRALHFGIFLNGCLAAAGVSKATV